MVVTGAQVQALMGLSVAKHNWKFGKSELEQKMADDIDVQKTCYLPASGFTHTHISAHTWVGKVVKAARKELGDVPIVAGISPYREQSREHLSCDLHSPSNDKWFPITLCAQGEHEFLEVNGGAAEADVYDMAEALHVAGMIVAGLNASISLGRRQNEVNEAVMASPLPPGHTNGPISLSFE